MCKGVREEFNKLYYQLTMDFYIWSDKSLQKMFVL